ncbi:sensor histidine kinase [Cellulosilyticum sp. I15G10I2]|uniref:sensor histidine kinase n=1 Tax=Cellulosilyticum sp. I15G10I2 TaxID=1892843 RepID=UPI00085C25BE|nr:sensor histidine kinase [Cellulosilyticum sp. I15G10I2]
MEFYKSISRMNLKKKILLGYIVLITIPLAIVTAVNYFSSVKVLESKTKKQLGIAGNAINEQYNNYFMDINDISNDITRNTYVQEILKRSSENVTNEKFMNVTLQREISDYFMGICNRKSGISAILLHGCNGLNYYYSTGYSWNMDFDSSEEKWFKDTVAADGRWVLTGKRIDNQLLKIGGTKEEFVTFGRVIKDDVTYLPLGVLQINISVDHLSKIGLSSVKEGYVAIYDAQGKLITDSAIEKAEEFIEISNISSLTHWQTVYYAPKHELLKEIKQTRNIMMMVTIIIIMVAVVFANFISYSIAKPIKKILERMKLVSSGDFETKIEYDKQDEMGELIDRFNHMTYKVKELIEEIHRKEYQRLKTEIDALQAQINPHFLYNTLNSIRLTAMMEGNKKMTKLLTSFVYLLRSAAKCQGALISIEEDLKILEAYCELMKHRYDHFTLQIVCEEEIRSYFTIPFILQPLVENAIFHGIPLEKKEGLIEIIFKQEEESVKAIVRDNGDGMDEKTVAKLLIEEGENKDTFSSLGVKNVYDRLKLNFEDKAAMTIYSEKNLGTTIELTWPALRGREMNDQHHDCRG